MPRSHAGLVCLVVGFLVAVVDAPLAGNRAMRQDASERAVPFLSLRRADSPYCS